MKTKHKAVLHGPEICTRPYYELPATLEAYNVQVEAMAKAIWRGRIKYAMPPKPLAELQAMYRRQARNALSVIGISRPNEK